MEQTQNDYTIYDIIKKKYKKISKGKRDDLRTTGRNGWAFSRLHTTN